MREASSQASRVCRGGADIRDIVKRIDMWAIDMLFVVGGNGGNAGANAIQQMCQRDKVNCAVIGCACCAPSCCAPSGEVAGSLKQHSGYEALSQHSGYKALCSPDQAQLTTAEHCCSCSTGFLVPCSMTLPAADCS